MAARRSTTLLLVALVASAALGVGVWVAAGLEDAPREERAIPTPEPTAVRRAVIEETPELVEIEREVEATPETTTVLWPLEVELQLLRSDVQPSLPGLTAMGSGRDAILRGHVVDSRGDGVQAEVEFVAGPNRGRLLQADSTGRFGATDLYPGLAIVEVRGRGIPGSRRERLLRPRVETLLNIGYGLPASIEGRVVNEANEPVAAARVSIDGVVTSTDLDGYFWLSGLAAGSVLAEVSHPEHASLRQKLGLTVRTTAKDVVFQLHPQAVLGVSLEGVGRSAGPVQIVVLPANPNAERDFPWHTINPVIGWPGDLVRITGLPAEHVQIVAIGEGAVSEPRIYAAHIDLGAMETVHVKLVPRPVLEGVVTQNGEPVANATVRLEAPDRVQAAARWLSQPTTAFEVDVWPPLAPAVQEMETESDGRFRFAAFEETSPQRYLVATGPDGRASAGRVVEAGEREVRLELEERTGDAYLVLELPGRIQPLRASVSVNGAPRDEVQVATDGALIVEGLVDGEWALTVKWHGETLLAEPRLRVVAKAEREVPLPAAAIQGQDRDAWERAGETYPD
jgi:protocatechuate 3,4-dioxygenase beta subunit